MARSNKERTAKHRARKAAIEFSNDYLDGKTQVTPEEFIDGKIHEMQRQTLALVTGFEYAVTNPFYRGLEDLEESDGSYDIIDLFILWKSVLDDLK